MKRLVEIDPRTYATKELDHTAIQRSAGALREYLLGLDAEDDEYRIREQVLPLVEKALAGELEVPLRVRDKPLRYEGAEGLLPREYEKISAPFWVAIMGMGGLSNELMKPIRKDGKLYVWMDFEE